MHDSPLISAPELAGLAEDGQVVIFDCRFDLQHPHEGRRSWLDGHIPGAVYAHLDDDLAAPVTATSGRHPLPDAGSFAAFLGDAGWAPGMSIVAYDAHGGVFAARLWWLMRYYGHECVRVLDGGIAAWRAVPLPLEAGPVRPARRPAARLQVTPGMTLAAADVADGLSRASILLLDARDPARFEGRVEPLDVVAGHIPGARNHPFAGNLAQGRMRPAAELRRSFELLLQGRVPGDVVHMCGSGVTACHNLLAMEVAGLCGSRLYPGSWSEWIRDPARPVGTGPA